MRKLVFSGFFLGIIFVIALTSGCANRNGAASTDANTETAVAAVDKALEESEQVEVQVDKDRVICRRDHVAGSNFPRRVCRTVKQIEEERLASQRQLEMEKTRGINKRIDIGN